MYENECGVLEGKLQFSQGMSAIEYSSDLRGDELTVTSDTSFIGIPMKVGTS